MIKCGKVLGEGEQGGPVAEEDSSRHSNVLSFSIG